MAHLSHRPDGLRLVADPRPVFHWDDLLRLTSSLHKGTMTASLILDKLASYPRQNGLAWALREVGRVEKSLFTLEWL